MAEIKLTREELMQISTIPQHPRYGVCNVFIKFEPGHDSPNPAVKIELTHSDGGVDIINARVEDDVEDKD